jgi:hypothetical protein
MFVMHAAGTPAGRHEPCLPAHPFQMELQETGEGYNDSLGFGLAAMQGWRVSMVGLGGGLNACNLCHPCSLAHPA